MKTIRLLGILCVSWVAFAFPAAAQNPGQTTPATSGICDGLGDATPGLQGLCVAMCEAQTCEAEVNPVTGLVEFDPSCKPSSEQLLANYNKLAGPADPPMPCVKVACPCWTEAELENVADENDQCVVYENIGFTWLYGNGSNGGREQAYVSKDPVSGLTCVVQEASSGTYAQSSNIGSAAYARCQETLLKECARR